MQLLGLELEVHYIANSINVIHACPSNYLAGADRDRHDLFVAEVFDDDYLALVIAMTQFNIVCADADNHTLLKAVRLRTVCTWFNHKIG